MSPGHDVVLRDRLGVVERGARRRRTAAASPASAASGPVRSLRDTDGDELRRRGERGAGRGRDRRRRPRPGSTGRSPRRSFAREVRPGCVTTNCARPCASAARPASSSGSSPMMREVLGRRHRLHERARELAVVGDDQRGRHVLGIGVDRVAEQRELDDRDADDHPERHAVAAELQELLGDHRPPALRTRRRRSFAWRLGASPKLSVAPCIRWMNTSSSPVPTGCDARSAPRAVASRSDRSSSGGVLAGDVNRLAERDGLLDARHRAQALAQGS